MQYAALETHALLCMECQKDREGYEKQLSEDYKLIYIKYKCFRKFPVPGFIQTQELECGRKLKTKACQSL